MSLDVHIHVAFACHQNDEVAALARQHLETLTHNGAPADLDGYREARQFLAALSERSGPNPGLKGGLSLWGLVGNYTDPEQFVEILRPFWLALLSSQFHGGPCRFEHIVVLYQSEHMEAAGAIEISLVGHGHGPGEAVLRVKRFPALPFTWNQY